MKIGRRTVALSNLDKVFYPEVGFTKGEMLDCYIRVAPVLIPHLKNHPLTLKRYPNGAAGMFFYEKNCPKRRPDWFKTVEVWSESRGENIHFCLVNDLAPLVWTANLATLELHTSLSLAKSVDRPVFMVFDLDPGAPATLTECCAVALWIKEFFDARRIEAFPKTSGSKGLQLYVPLNYPKATYQDTKTFAHALALKLEKEHPNQVVSFMKKSLREGKVFVDWSQNDEHKTTVCVYSLRAKQRPTVSTPLNWEEISRIQEKFALAGSRVGRRSQAN